MWTDESLLYNHNRAIDLTVPRANFLPDAHEAAIRFIWREGLVKHRRLFSMGGTLKASFSGHRGLRRAVGGAVTFNSVQGINNTGFDLTRFKVLAARRETASQRRELIKTEESA